MMWSRKTKISVNFISAYSFTQTFIDMEFVNSLWKSELAELFQILVLAGGHLFL